LLTFPLASPTVKAQKLDNVSAALSMLPHVGVMPVFLSPDNIVNMDRTMVLGLIWRLILAKQIVALSSGGGNTLGGDGKWRYFIICIVHNY
jgi:hypothetical protein